MLPVVFKRSQSLPSFVDEFFGRDLLSDFFDVPTNINTPAVNIMEGKEDFRIEVAAPGLSKDDFRINLHNNMLVISSEKQENREEKDGKYVRREFGYSSFKRSFTLPNTVNGDKINASYIDGVLQIIIPKKEEAKEKLPHEIKIS